MVFLFRHVCLAMLASFCVLTLIRVSPIPFTAPTGKGTLFESFEMPLSLRGDDEYLAAFSPSTTLGELALLPFVKT